MVEALAGPLRRLMPVRLLASATAFTRTYLFRHGCGYALVIQGSISGSASNTSATRPRPCSCTTAKSRRKAQSGAGGLTARRLAGDSKLTMVMIQRGGQ